jgi:phosphoglycerate dehydrogenase-like enzyme
VSFRILISAPYMLRERELVEPMLDHPQLELVWADVEERLEEDALLDQIDGVHGMLCGDDRVTRRVLERAKDLRAIVKWGTGIDSIDSDSARELGVAVRRTPDAFTDPVADTTLALMLDFARGITANDRILKQGGWDKPQGYALCERTVGIVGVGAIGSAVARRLAPFGATVLGNDIRQIDSQLLAETGLRMVSLEELLEQADFVSLHCDLNPTSAHILDGKRFAQMQRKPVVLNTARGPLIEEPSLVAALQSGQVAGAGLDVFEDEPLPLDSPLRSMDQVRLAAHNSNSSPARWTRVHRNSVAMLKEELGLA